LALLAVKAILQKQVSEKASPVPKEQPESGAAHPAALKAKRLISVLGLAVLKARRE